MRTAIVSDLHLGSLIGTDLARDGEVRRALLDELEGADRVVLLGDTFELRDMPPSRVIERAGPFFADFREAVGEIGGRHRPRQPRPRPRRRGARHDP